MFLYNYYPLPLTLVIYRLCKLTFVFIVWHASYLIILSSADHQHYLPLM